MLKHGSICNLPQVTAGLGRPWQARKNFPPLLQESVDIKTIVKTSSSNHLILILPCQPVLWMLQKVNIPFQQLILCIAHYHTCLSENIPFPKCIGIKFRCDIKYPLFSLLSAFCPSLKYSSRFFIAFHR